MLDMTVGNMKIGVIPDMAGFAEKLRAGLGQAMRDAAANFQGAQTRMGGAAASGSSSAAAHISLSQSRSQFVGGGGFGGSANGIPYVNGSGQAMINAMQRAADAMTSAASRLSQAVGQSMSPAGGGGGGGGGGRGGFPNARGFSRYIAGGFIAREALRGFDVGREYASDSLLANGRPGAQLAAENRLAQGIGSIPVVGQAASLILDPFGREKLYTDSTAAAAGGAEDFARLRMGLNSETLGIRRQTQIAGLSGFARQRAEVQAKYQEQTAALSAYRSSPELQGKVDQQIANEKAAISQDFGSQIKTLNNGAGQGGLSALAASQLKDLQMRQESALQFADQRRPKYIDNAIAEKRKALGPMMDAELSAIEEEEKQRIDEYGRGKRLNEAMMGGPNRRAIRSIDVNNSHLEAERIKQSFGANSDAYINFVDYEKSRFGLEDDRQHREDFRHSFRLRSEIGNESIYTSDRGTPGERGMRIKARSILQDTQESALNAFETGRGDDVPEIYKLGRLRANGLEQDFLNGLRPTQVDLNRTDISSKGNTEDAGRIQAEIRDVLKSLGEKIPQKMDELLRQMLNSMATAG